MERKRNKLDLRITHFSLQNKLKILDKTVYNTQEHKGSSIQFQFNGHQNSCFNFCQVNSACYPLTAVKASQINKRLLSGGFYCINKLQFQSSSSNFICRLGSSYSCDIDTAVLHRSHCICITHIPGKLLFGVMDKFLVMFNNFNK